MSDYIEKDKEMLFSSLTLENDVNNSSVVNPQEQFDIQKSIADFVHYVNEHKEELNSGFGAFHTNNHGNW